MLRFANGAETMLGAQGNRAAMVFGSQRTGRFKRGRKKTGWVESRYSLVLQYGSSRSSFAVVMESRRYSSFLLLLSWVLENQNIIFHIYKNKNISV